MQAEEAVTKTEPRRQRPANKTKTFRRLPNSLNHLKFFFFVHTSLLLVTQQRHFAEIFFFTGCKLCE